MLSLSGARGEHSTLSVSLSSDWKPSTVDCTLRDTTAQMTLDFLPWCILVLLLLTATFKKQNNSLHICTRTLDQADHHRVSCTDLRGAAPLEELTLKGCNKHSLLSVGLQQNNSLINECRLRFKHPVTQTPRLGLKKKLFCRRPPRKRQKRRWVHQTKERIS